MALPKGKLIPVKGKSIAGGPSQGGLGIVAFMERQKPRKPKVLKVQSKFKRS